MDEALHATLAGWGNFYLITGTAAAALTGLQFVVQTLIASNALRPASGSDPESGISTFGTPTVVHFTLALVVSCALCVPWPDVLGLRELLGALGAGALAYAALVFRRARRQRIYVPVIEDWVWHVTLPGAAYTAVLLAAVLLARHAEVALFALAAATLVLLCVGIHNAWDTVTYLTVHAVRAAPPGHESAPQRPKESGARGRRRR